MSFGEYIDSAFDDLKRSPLMSISNLLSILTTFFTVFISIFGLSDSAENFVILERVAKAPIALQLVIVAILASGLGWTMGLVLAFLSRTSSDLRNSLTHLTAFCFASLLIFFTTWLAGDASVRNKIEAFEIFLVLGASVAVTLVRLNFEAIPVASRDAAARRNFALLTFVSSVFAIAILEQVIGA